ncbi:MAG: hypothetical protein ACJ75M_21270, partial [Actinomycetes bacterium]
MQVRGGSRLGTVLEPTAPVPPGRAGRPGGRPGGNHLCRPLLGRDRHRAVGLGHGSAAVPKLHWGSCAAEGPGLEAFQCATAVVPLDYDKPKG